jgi:hypothetical protein
MPTYLPRELRFEVDKVRFRNTDEYRIHDGSAW